MIIPVRDADDVFAGAKPGVDDQEARVPTEPCDIVIVLDRSGSMDDCRDTALGAINGYLQVVATSGIDGLVSVIIFDSQSIDEIRSHVPLSSCALIRPEEFVPRALTPLLDAIGRGVAQLDQRQGSGRRAILAILTDGYENASREYTYTSIKALLEARKAAGWLVVYLGADHDAWTQASALGIDAGLTAGFAKERFGAVEQGLTRVSRQYVQGFQPSACAFSNEDREAMTTEPPFGSPSN